MNFLKTFLALTEYTVPFGYEHTLERLLPPGFEKDQWGNYFYVIGKSKTLFTAHLDTASDKYEKVKHIITYSSDMEVLVSTDKSTILGGDNKAGCLILFYMIENQIPGLYYFFVGEESAVHGNFPYGSLMAIETHKADFFRYERAISFDRKEKGQLVTRQIARDCCSDMFAGQLINKFSKLGIDLVKDNTGYYTDSAFFVDIITEVVNISCGVYNEHTVNEYVNLTYVKKIAEACVKLDWESLVISSNRRFNLSNSNYKDDKFLIDSRQDTDEAILKTKSHSVFEEVFNIFDDLYYFCHEIRNYQNYLVNFKEERVYHFTKWHEDESYAIKIINTKIHVYKYVYNLNSKIIHTNKTNTAIYWYNNGLKFNTIEDFKKYLGFEKLDNLSLLLTLKKGFGKDNKITDAKFNYILKLKESSKDEVIDLFNKTGFDLIKIGKGYELAKL